MKQSREAALGQTVHQLFTIHLAKLKCEDLIVIFKSTCYLLSCAFLEIRKKKKSLCLPSTLMQT